MAPVCDEVDEEMVADNDFIMDSNNQQQWQWFRTVEILQKVAKDSLLNPHLLNLMQRRNRLYLGVTYWW